MEFLTDVLQALKDLSGSRWFYLVIMLGTLFDSVFPVAPSESLVIAGGVSAGLGDLNLGLVILAAWVGAFCGDHVSYLVGRRASAWFMRRADRRQKTANRLAWASNQIRVRGGLLLITARFVPAGRTVLTLAAGITRQRMTWFTAWVIVAVSIWSTYASMLGFIGGQAFEDNENAAFIAAFGFAFGVTGLAEVVRFIRNRRLAQRLKTPVGAA